MLNWISSACILQAVQAGPLYVNTKISMEPPDASYLTVCIQHHSTSSIRPKCDELEKNPAIWFFCERWKTRSFAKVLNLSSWTMQDFFAHFNTLNVVTEAVKAGESNLRRKLFDLQLHQPTTISTYAYTLSYTKINDNILLRVSQANNLYLLFQSLYLQNGRNLPSTCVVVAFLLHLGGFR